jgi:hypothetical protein
METWLLLKNRFLALIPPRKNNLAQDFKLMSSSIMALPY